MKQYASAKEAQADVGASPISLMAQFPEGYAARADQLGLQGGCGEMACGEEAAQEMGGQGSQGPVHSESGAGEDQATSPEAEEGEIQAQHSSPDHVEMGGEETAEQEAGGQGSQGPVRSESGTDAGQATSPEAEEGGFQAQHSTPDHIKIGGEEVVEVPPHTLTVGELNALADYVKDVSDLKDITPALMEVALELLGEHDHHHGGLTPQESEVLAVIFPDYQELAKANDSHFAPPSGLNPTGTADHVSQMKVHFGKAFDIAQGNSTIEESARTEAARAEAAFGSHYIADAFSAGHLFNKAELMTRAADFLDQGLNDHLTFLMAAEATHKKAAATLSQWEVRTIGGQTGWGPIHATHLFLLLQGMYLGGMEDMIYNAYVRVVHDRIGALGVEVQSPHGEWVMGGDEHLDTTSTSAAKEAVAAAMDLIEAEAESPGTTSKSEMFEAILSHYPTPTVQGQATIDGTIDGVFESTVEAATALAEASTAEMDAILQQVQEQSQLPGLPLLRRVAPAAGGQKGPEERDPDVRRISDIGKELDDALDRLRKGPEERDPAAPEQGDGREEDATSLDDLMAADRLTVEQIQRARELIAEKPAEEQGPLYEELQTKVKYLNQLNNESDKEKPTSGGTCAMTSLTMCFMYLGIPNPDPSKQYEDALLALCAEKGWNITAGATWEKVGKELGATLTYREGGKYKQEWFEGTLKGWLQGQGVLVSINNHVVRIEGVTDEGLVVDDPFGASKLLKGKERGWDKLNSDEEDGSSEANVGEDHIWSWASVTGFDFKYFFTVQAA